MMPHLGPGCGDRIIPAEKVAPHLKARLALGLPVLDHLVDTIVANARVWCEVAVLLALVAPQHADGLTRLPIGPGIRTFGVDLGFAIRRDGEVTLGELLVG